MENKQILRHRLRKERRDHVAAIPDKVRALLFHRPPQALEQMIRPGAAIGLYHATHQEAPTGNYACHFHESGHRLALPFFAHRDAAMEFRQLGNPYADALLQPGPHSIAQPLPGAEAIQPDVVFVPLVGFTATGERLGQGGGHYDRWLADNPAVTAIGLAWDCQLVEELPLEPHDRRLDAIITPTRLYRPF